MKTDDILKIPADLRLAEELASEDVVEMANLTTAPDGRARHHFHFNGNGRAWTAS